uniref:DUF4218 domain-containing protein n=1 Tax=Tanacetum cinerariifolium TaxID=118510 RepID=A0A699I9C4_TANCI|nr:hypothetical protein [Tanacetum cinerariifolium]
MSDMIVLLNDLSYIPSNNEQNEPTQGDIDETSNELTQAKRNEFEELYASAKEELYSDCDYGDNNKDVHLCPVCKTSKWKDSNTPRNKVPKKVLRYFLIIPRLQHLYKSSHTIKEMTWHETGKCTEPGVETIDVAIGQKFNIRAMVLWTINDFPARSSLSGGVGNVTRHALHQYLPDEVAKPIIELCSFFKKICYATLMEDDMLKSQSKVVDILCNLELIYPPAFFDIMIHLVIL